MTTESEPAPRGQPKGSGVRRVYAAVRERVLSLAFPPGMNIDEARLVAEFQVSRTPVREALIRLASEGLIDLTPNRGARVAPLDLADVPQLLEALELNQRATNRWAALRRRPDQLAAIERAGLGFAEAAKAGDFRAMSEQNKLFHDVIAEAARNRYLRDQGESLTARSLRLSRLNMSTADDAADYFAEVDTHHQEMIDAIRRQKPDRAERLAEDHARLFRARVARFVQDSAASGVRVG